MYFFTLSNFNFSSKITSDNITIENLKKYANNIFFKDNLIIKCIDDGKKCLVYDGDTLIQELNNVFEEKPIVYTYNKKLDTIEFEDLELKHLDTYEVCFEFKIDKYGKTKDMIVEVAQKIYVFNSFYKDAIKLDYLSDVSDYFDNLNNKVRDAI